MAASGLKLFPRATGLFLRCAYGLLARVKVEGLENLPGDGAVMVVCNHASNADGMLLMAYVVPKLGRPMGWIGKEEALRWPLAGWAMKQNGVFGVKRSGGDLEAFKTAKRVLDEGRPLAVFPEGTRSPDGALREAKEGATVLAIRSGSRGAANRNRRLAALLAAREAAAPISPHDPSDRADLRADDGRGRRSAPGNAAHDGGSDAPHRRAVAA